MLASHPIHMKKLLISLIARICVVLSQAESLRATGRNLVRLEVTCQTDWDEILQEDLSPSIIPHIGARKQLTPKLVGIRRDQIEI